MHPLVWDRETEACQVGPGGPCGSQSGLSVSCRSGLDCIEGRCRAEAEVGSRAVGAFCNDSVDCKKGLECRVSETKTMLKIGRCYETK